MGNRWKEVEQNKCVGNRQEMKLREIGRETWSRTGEVERLRAGQLRPVFRIPEGVHTYLASGKCSHVHPTTYTFQGEKL